MHNGPLLTHTSCMTTFMMYSSSGFVSTGFLDLNRFVVACSLLTLLQVVVRLADHHPTTVAKELLLLEKKIISMKWRGCRDVKS